MTCQLAVDYRSYEIATTVLGRWPAGTRDALEVVHCAQHRAYHIKTKGPAPA